MTRTVRAMLQSAFVLHSRPYRDTSLLVELLTAEYGCLTILARGVRSQRSRFHGLLAPFLPLLVSFSGKSDLQVLQQVEANGLSYNLVGNVLLSGFYLNELLVRLLQRHEPHPNVYQAYQHTLAALLGATQPEPALRLFEKSLLTDLGYGLQLDRTIDNEPVLPSEKYIFKFGTGLKKVQSNDPYNFSGQSLLALHFGTLITRDELRDAKRLLRSVLAVLLGNKPLKSRELFLK
jgi:DNA repair protein RecO (recombination protein O)